MKIEVESEALDTLKAMAQRLQDERDALYDAVMEVSTAEDSYSQSRAIDDCILIALSLDAKPEVME